MLSLTIFQKRVLRLSQSLPKYLCSTSKIDNTVSTQQTATNDQQGQSTEQVRNRLIKASLLHVNKIGWNERAIAAACTDLNLSSAFHGVLAPYDLILHMMRQWDEKAFSKIKANDSLLLDPQAKIKDKIQYGIRERLSVQTPYLSRWNEAMALGAHPNNARQTAQILWNYADEVWTLAGDRSLDYNHYTKRAIFLGIYASTELYLLTDLSENYKQTWAFLQRRVEDVLTLGAKLQFFKNFSTATLSGVLDVASAFYSTGNVRPEDDLREFKHKYQDENK